MIRFELAPPPCYAIKDGRRCERRSGHPGNKHWYTHWTHPNQYGSFPSYAVEWQDPSRSAQS